MRHCTHANAAIQLKLGETYHMPHEVLGKKERGEKAAGKKIEG